MPELEVRQAKIEGIVEQADKRLSNVEDLLKITNQRIDRLTYFLITMWITIMLAILGLYFKG
jgi:CHASE3 domain sensor protein